MVPGEDEIATNLRRGTLEFCVLGVLAGGPAYGLELARRLSADVPLLASEGTLYPLLARLRRSGWVHSTWQESTSGPPRRYYQLTDDGRAALGAFLTVWTRFAAAVSDTVKGTR